ncbi:MAG TPA: SCO6880 family protein [Acidimicrobiales bacterium]|nr:SCO6880 family protein [Acidimicrobiales bacterium]
MSGREGTQYRFGPRERGGGLAGWRAGQILTVAVGLVFGVLVLRWSPDALGVVAAVGILVLYGALATVPVAGRTGDEWLPVVVCWGARRTGARAGGGAAGRTRTGMFRGVRFLRAGWRDMGVVHDRVARTLTAALTLRGGSFALLGADEQDRRVGAWASVLASLAREGSSVHRVQWVAASFPDDGSSVRSYFASDAVTRVAPACTASYEALLAEMDSRTSAHDVVLAVQVRTTRSVEVGCAALAREVESLLRLLGDADVRVASLLSADDLALQLLRTYEPRVGTSEARVPTPVLDPWPMAVEERWSSVRVDGMVHATFWVSEWPRVEVRSDFLAPLLLGAARSTFSVVMEPLGSDAAVRKVEASRTADLADAELRRRGGFVSTARHARESEVLARREAELAEGHASFRYSGYVTVSAPTDEELESAIDVVQHAAGQSRLALRRLYGDQASAYTCTLPLCRGLR